MSTRLVLLHALSPLHCGTGQAVSGIDLPIAREKATGTPIVPGSSLKGVLRARPAGYEPSGDDRAMKALHRGAFGPETERASEHAGAVQFADAHLLFLPIRSVRGTFAWVTSPHLLRRLSRVLREVGLEWKVPGPPAKNSDALVTGNRLIVKHGTNDRVVFEDFDFDARPSKELGTFATSVGRALFGKDESEVQHFVERVCVVGDDVMRVLGRVGMEVVARNRIDDDARTVAVGALWTEEALPAETILAGAISITPVRREDSEPALLEHVRALCRGPLQIGGKATVGRGVCRVEVV